MNTLNQERLVMKNISKSFPGVKALDNVSFDIKAGEVHSLIGQNGAGKSTLMGILNGITKPDSGEIYINNNIVRIDDPNDAFNLRLSIVHQEFALCNNLTVAQNIFLGSEPFNKGGFINNEEINNKSIDLLKKINVNLNIDNIVGDLNTSEWQIIEICKALSKNPKFIIMDEPTASLDESQIENLFSIIVKLKMSGIGIIYISHKLSEIIKVSDRITIIRDGKISETFAKKEADENILIKSMIGQKVLEINKRENVFNIDNTDFFQIDNFTCNNKFYDINISLQKGEILGLSGLLGSGTSDLLRSIFGIIKEDSGDIIYKKNKLVINAPKDSISFGIGYLPSDRKNEGLIQDNSVRDNSILTIFKTISNLGFFSSNNAKRITNEFVQKLQVKVSDINTSVMNLSGGNQQKIVIAKWLAKNCDILLFDDPTRGIDVAAKYQIWNLISEFSNNGGSVIVASNEIPELINGCDRIITMNKGKITKTFSKNDFNEEKISLNISSNIN